LRLHTHLQDITVEAVVVPLQFNDRTAAEILALLWHDRKKIHW
jgi:hypothetical protein